MKHFSTLLWMICLFSQGLIVHGKTLFDELSEHDRKIILSNQRLTLQTQRNALHPNEKGKDSVWPEVTILHRIPAHPSAVAATYADLESYPVIFTGVPGFKFKKITLNSKNFPEIDATYHIALSALALEFDTEYAMHNRWSQEDNSYTNQWSYIAGSSKQIHHCEGYLHVEPFEDGSLVHYHQYINPKEPFLLPRKALKAASKTFVESQEALTDAARRYIEVNPEEVAKKLEQFENIANK